MDNGTPEPQETSSGVASLSQLVVRDIKALGRLDSTQIRELASALRGAASAQVSTPAGLAFTIRASGVGSSDDAPDLASALGALYFGYFSSGDSQDAFIENVAKELQKQVRLSDPDTGAFRDRLRDLLDIAPLETALRGQALAQAHQNLLLAADVITNLRPVYGRVSTEIPSGAVLTYTLVLQYRDHATRELHVGLDESDIHKLRQLFEETEKKLAATKKWLKTTEVRHVEV